MILSIEHFNIKLYVIVFFFFFEILYVLFFSTHDQGQEKVTELPKEKKRKEKLPSLLLLFSCIKPFSHLILSPKIRLNDQFTGYCIWTVSSPSGPLREIMIMIMHGVMLPWMFSRLFEYALSYAYIDSVWYK